MKLYAILKGEYSDRHIVALTASREKAEALQKICSDRYSDADIETYEDGELQDYKFWWHYDAYYDEIEMYDECLLKDEYAAGDDAYVCAPNPERARKKAHDMIAKYKAKRAGL